ncbi:hypothetical protein [Actinacidiphila acididurans]|nr:hypothetical protein [Actinacidiphila acididurans]
MAARLWVHESWRQVAFVPGLVALSVVYREWKRRQWQSEGEEK